MTDSNLAGSSSMEGHEWRWVKDTPLLSGFWTLYECRECGSTYQVEYFESHDPCRVREAVSPASETGS